MTRRAAPRSLGLAAIVSILGFAAATHDPAEALLGLVLYGAGMLVTSRLRAALIPGWAAGVLAVAVLARTVTHALESALDVSAFASLVLWLLVIKAYDRRSGHDDAQALALTVFLCVGSILLSNGVTVAMISFLYLPCLAYAAMRVQLELQSARATRIASRGADEPITVRHAASPRSGLSLARTSLYSVAGGLVIAVVVFVIIPRGTGLARIGNWGNPGVGRVVGFSDRMRVGMGGVISESNTAVLHLRITDSEGNPFGGAGALQYVRGAVLDTYADGVWESSSPPSRSARAELLPTESVRFRGSGQSAVLRQEYTILNTPPDYSYLFTLWRPIEITYLDPGIVARNERDMTVMHLGSGGKFRYAVRSSPYEPDAPPQEERQPASFDSEVVARVAGEILRDRGLEPDPARRPISDDASVIGAFREHFWSNYTYRLGTPPSPPALDPIDWFLTDARDGHCEYYASAMTALCRSVGVPARVVTGYLAMEYDPRTAHYVVRERNAHAWVEAQVEPGRWRAYEPTPPADLVRVHAPEGGLLARAGRALDLLNYQWVNSVVDFDGERRSSILGWSDPATKSLHEQITRALDFTRLTPSGVLIRVVVHIAITVVGGFLSAYAVIMLLRRWRLARSRRPRAMLDRIESGEIRQRVLACPIHRELLAAMRAAGVHKPGWQPLLDWAGSLGEHSPSASEIARLFYVVRFGGRQLTPEETERARTLLAALRRTPDNR